MSPQTVRLSWRCVNCVTQAEKIMRKIGVLQSAEKAETLHRFLLAEGIENRIDQVPPDWEVWVVSDDDLEKAKAELDSFINFPDDPRFRVKHVPARPSKPAVQSRPQRRRPSSDIPVTRFLIVSCVMIALYTGFGKSHADLQRWLVFSKYVKPEPIWIFPPEILQGEIWRIFTPALMHGSLLHLGFNMYLMWILGNTLERTQGSGRFLFYCLLTGAGAHFTQYIFVGPNFLGISGVVYGLIGYLWMRQMVAPEDGYFVPEGLLVTMLFWLILGVTGALESWGMPVANGAHLGGLFAGMLLGSFQRRSYSAS